MESQERQTVRDALRWAVRLLSARAIPTPRLDAELLLAHVLRVAREHLPGLRANPLAGSTAATFTSLIRRRAEREPVAYLIGHRAFWDLDVLTDARALIPRPESEHLLEQAQLWLRPRTRPVRSIADVGTGSGELAIALARMAPAADVYATDLSPGALTLARDNLRRYGLQDAARLVCCDLLSALSHGFDLVVANLPYVMSDEIPTLDADVRGYEPLLALDGGADGLDHIRRLLSDVPRCLSEDGLMLLEIDPRQASTVVALGRRMLPGATIAVIRDLAHRDRVVRVALGAPQV